VTLRGVAVVSADEAFAVGDAGRFSIDRPASGSGGDRSGTEVLTAVWATSTQRSPSAKPARF